MKRPTPLFWLCTKSPSTRTMPRLISARIAASRAELAAALDQHRFELAADLRILAAGIALEEGAQAVPRTLGQRHHLRPRQQLALQLLGAAGEGRASVRSCSTKPLHEAVELGAQRMVGIGRAPRR